MWVCVCVRVEKCFVSVSVIIVYVYVHVCKVSLLRMFYLWSEVVELLHSLLFDCMQAFCLLVCLHVMQHVSTIACIFLVQVSVVSSLCLICSIFF